MNCALKVRPTFGARFTIRKSFFLSLRNEMVILQDRTCKTFKYNENYYSNENQ